MKTQNTPENKAKFYGLYFGQEVERFKGGNDTYSVNGKSFRGHQLAPLPGSYLSLKPLSQITDEDAIEIANLLSAWYSNTNESAYYDLAGFSDYLQEVFLEGIGGLAINNTASYVTAVDFLRSKGYLLPWMDLSVEEIISYGWAKYINQ